MSRIRSTSKIAFVVICLGLVQDPGSFAESAKTTGTIRKAPPTGIWLLPFSWGKNHPDQMNKLDATPCWTNPNVDGIVLRADWDKIEQTDGEIDFGYFDKGFELAEKNHKRIQ